MNQNSRVNKTDFHMKGFALGLALKQSRNATRKSPIEFQRNSVKKTTLLLHPWPGSLVSKC